MIWKNYISSLLVLGLMAGLIAWGATTSLPSPNLQEISQGPSKAHLFGTSPDGRDLFDLSLALAVRAMGESLWATVLTLVVGLLVGFSAANLVGGFFDRAQSAVAKLFDSVGPFLFVACLAAIAPRISTWKLGVFLAFVAWPSVSSVVRSEAIQISRLSYVEAARSVGVSPLRIAMNHLLPSMLERIGPLCFGIYVGFLALFGAVDFIGARISSQQSLGFAIFESTGFLRSNRQYFLTCFTAFILLLLVSAGIAWMIKRINSHRYFAR